MTKPDKKGPPVAATTEGAGNAEQAIAGETYDQDGAAGKIPKPAAFAHSAHARESLPDGFTGPPVWTLEKREGVLIAGEREYKGSLFFELRLWAGEGGKPTSKGITMPCDAVTGLAEALAAYAANRG